MLPIGTHEWYHPHEFYVNKVAWPSGLRRWFKAPVRKGVGSNPTAAKVLFYFIRAVTLEKAMVSHTHNELFFA